MSALAPPFRGRPIETSSFPTTGTHIGDELSICRTVSSPSLPPSRGTTPQDRQVALAWAYGRPGWGLMPIDPRADTPAIVFTSPHDGDYGGWAIERQGRTVFVLQNNDPEPLGEFARIEDALAEIERATA